MRGLGLATRQMRLMRGTLRNVEDRNWELFAVGHDLPNTSRIVRAHHAVSHSVY